MREADTRSALGHPHVGDPGLGLPTGNADTQTGVTVSALALAQTRPRLGDEGPADSGDEAPLADPMIGARFGNFVVVRRLCRGGMGVVYEVKHSKIERRAVVKVLNPKYAVCPEVTARFLNEARVVNMIGHPNLVEIFDYGQLPDGTMFIVMEYLQGKNLSKTIEEPAELPSDKEVIELAVQVAHALAAAHRKGVIHRDLKPDNIMLVSDPTQPAQPRVKVIDFGLATIGELPSTAVPEALRISRPGTILGTPMYMAPEQFDQSSVDGQADVFSLGVILYQLLARQLPYQRTASSLRTTPATPLDALVRGVSPSLVALIHRMISPDPKCRPDMAELAGQLETMRTTTAQVPPVGRAPRYQQLLVLGAVVLLAIGAALVRRLMPPRVSAAEAKRHALSAIASGLKADDPSVQIAAIKALARSFDPSKGSLLTPMLHSDKPELAAEAAWAIGQVSAFDAQPALLSLLSGNPGIDLQITIAEALARLGSAQGVQILTELYEKEPPDSGIKNRTAALLLDLGKPAGIPTLWRSLSRSSPTNITSLTVLSRLALAGEPGARQLLAQSLYDSSDPQGRLFAARSLAALGDEHARAILVEAASKPGRNQLLAAHFCAELGVPVGRELLMQVAVSVNESDVTRELAILGLASWEHEESLAVLDRVLSQSRTSPAIRLTAAGAVLHLIAGERAQEAKQSLFWIQLLVGGSPDARRLAAATLGELNAEETISPLGQALHDSRPSVRSMAARALGRKSTRAALAALEGALDDEDLGVRRAGLRAIRAVIESLRHGGDLNAAQLVLPRLSRLAREGSEEDHILASGMLPGHADRERAAELRAALTSTDPRIRRLAVELAEGDAGLFAQALADPETGVRIAAARRLADQGSHLGVGVLFDAAQQGGLDGLLAQGALHSLGERGPAVCGVSELLQSTDLQVQLDVLDAIQDLAPEAALPLLYLAARDAAAVIRRRVAEVATGFYRRTNSSAYLLLTTSFRHDVDPLVRSVVAALPAVPPPGPASRPAGAPGNNAPSASQNGLSQLAQAPATPATSAAALPQRAASPPVLVPSGPSVSHELVRRPARIARARLPKVSAERLLQDGLKALHANQLEAAEPICQRLQLLTRRGQVKPSLVPDIWLALGSYFEKRLELTKALHVYRKLQQTKAFKQRADIHFAVERALKRFGAAGTA